MKKNKHTRNFLKVVSLFLFAVILMQFASPGSYVSAQELAMAEDTAYAIRSEASLTLNSEVLSILKEDEAFEDTYAGVYMDENGNLIICVTEEDAISEYQGILTANVITTAVAEARMDAQTIGHTFGINTSVPADELIQYEIRAYPYHQLHDAQMALFEVSRDFSIVETRISDKDNNLTVLTTDDTNRPFILEYLTENGFPTEFIVFEHADSEGEEHGTIYAGQRCAIVGTLANPQVGGTIGFAASYNGQRGFVTAGHVVQALNNSIELYDDNGSIHSGTVKYFYCGGSIDAAFVAITDGSTVSSTMNCNGNKRNSSGTTDAVQGVEYVLAGITSGYTYGTVLSSSTTITSSSGSYYGFFTLSSAGQSGDSGGPISTRASNLLMGIYHGTGSTSSSTSVGAACSYSQISARGITYLTSGVTY